MSSSEEDIQEAEEYSDNFDSSPQPVRQGDPSSSSGSDMYQLSSSSTLLSVSKSDKSAPSQVRGLKEDEDLSGMLPGARYSDSSGSGSLDAMKLSGGSYDSVDNPNLKSPEVSGKRAGNQTIEEQPNEENEANSEGSHPTPEDPGKVQAQRLENAQKALAGLGPGSKGSGAGKRPASSAVPRNKNYRLGTNQFPQVAKVGKGTETFKGKSSVPKPAKREIKEEGERSVQTPPPDQFRTIAADKSKLKTKQLNEFQEYQSQLLQRERHFKSSPDPAPQPAARKSPPKVQPQPRSLGANLYKLHQLAESVTGKGSRMTLDSLPGTLLSAIKLMGQVIGPDFTDSEVSSELQQARACLHLLQTGAKDCMRTEKDYFEDTKTRTETYKGLLEEHARLQGEITQLKVQVEEGNKRLSTVESGKAVVKLKTGTYVRAGLLPDSALNMQLPNSSNTSTDLMRDDPIDAVVNKIERQGMSLELVFAQLDEDEDRVLTLGEIRAQIGKLGKDVDLTADEVDLIMKKLDENSDGVVTKEEFLALLDPKLAVQKEYRALIGDLEANDPIVIEEMILDMRMRGHLYQDELPNLLNQVKSNLPSEQRLVNRIKLLEQKMSAKHISLHSSPESTHTLHNQVAAMRFQLDETKGTMAASVQNRQRQVEKVQTEVNEKMKNAAVLGVQVAKARAETAYGVKQLEGLEVMRDGIKEKNRFIAAIMIQAMIKRWRQRRKFKVELVTKRHAARVIQRQYRSHVLSEKEKAAVKIQSQFRRIQAAKTRDSLQRQKATSKPESPKLPPDPPAVHSPRPTVHTLSPRSPVLAAEQSFQPSQGESQIFSFVESAGQGEKEEAIEDPMAFESQVEEEKQGEDAEEQVCIVCSLPAERWCQDCSDCFCLLCFDNNHYNIRPQHVYEDLVQLPSDLSPEEFDLLAAAKSALSRAKIDLATLLSRIDKSSTGVLTSLQLLEVLKNPSIGLSDTDAADLIELAVSRFYSEELQGCEYQGLLALLSY